MFFLFKGSACPFSHPPTAGDLCVDTSLACHYGDLIAEDGGTVTCCCGRCDNDMACVNQANGLAHWRPLPPFPSLCPENGSCSTSGESYDTVYNVFVTVPPQKLVKSLTQVW